MRIETISKESQAATLIFEQEETVTKTVRFAKDVFATFPSLGFDPISLSIGFGIGLSVATLVNHFLPFKDKEEGENPSDIKDVKKLQGKNAKSSQLMKTLNHRSNHGDTALHVGVKASNGGSHLEVLKLLLDEGADPNIPDNEGNTPLDTAIKNKNDEVISLLKSYGARCSKSSK
jgi:ankyrin repeat protein